MEVCSRKGSAAHVFDPAADQGLPHSFHPTSDHFRSG